MNLLKGGQGRTDSDMAGDAIVAIIVAGFAVALAIALVIRSLVI